MNRLSLPPLPVPGTDPSTGQSPTTETRLPQRWLAATRAIWLLVAVLTGVHFIASIPPTFVGLQRICVGSNRNGCLSPANVRQLHEMGFSLGFAAGYIVVLTIILALIWMGVGGILFWRKSEDRTAFFVSLGLVAFGGVGFAAPIDVLAGSFPAWSLVTLFLTFFGQTSLFLFAYLFPDGRFVPRWTSVLAAVLAVLVAYLFFFNAHFPFYTWLEMNQLLWVPFFLITGIFAQLYRYWRVSGPVQRQQTKWVIFGLTLAIVLSQAERFVENQVVLSPSMIALFIMATVRILSFLFIPLSIGIAVLHYRLWEINLLINRTLVYTLLTASVVGVYIVVVGSLGVLFQASGNLLISLLATGIIAMMFQPLRERLQRAVNRLIYGERDDPYIVLSRLGQRLEVTLAPEAVLPTIVETVSLALKLPYVAITLKQENTFTIAASSGTAVDNPVRLPLTYQGEQVGELLLAERTPGETFTLADRRLLDDIARQAGVAVHAVHLTKDLQRSRERLVTTREEERRRLRRDLHDEIGPTLAALNLQAGIVRTLIPTDPAAADALVVEWRTELRAAIANIRRVVYELRPPALDELGLVAAIRERAAQYSHQTSTLQVIVKAPDTLPPLPAAVEVAAYRIAQEALANAVHHAQAHTCSITISLGSELHLEILDDGVGIPAEHRVGVGLLSMRERAAELGGTCTIEPYATGGTRIFAQLPLPKE